MAQLADTDEKREFLTALGLEETGLGRVIRAGYALLRLVPSPPARKNACLDRRAWDQAPKRPADPHRFRKGFIRAETIAADFAALGGGKVQDAGHMRLEGADYVVQDGDVMHFRFNV
jgi:ribosome-binding ATPase YchF (GTP1/OBG family)